MVSTRRKRYSNTAQEENEDVEKAQVQETKDAMDEGRNVQADSSEDEAPEEVGLDEVRVAGFVLVHPTAKRRIEQARNGPGCVLARSHRRTSRRRRKEEELTQADVETARYRANERRCKDTGRGPWLHHVPSRTHSENGLELAENKWHTKRNEPNRREKEPKAWQVLRRNLRECEPGFPPLRNHPSTKHEWPRLVALKFECVHRRIIYS